jgi:glycine betaine catabolism B
MIMNNKDNKRSSGQWVQRLFKRGGDSEGFFHNKVYFAHQYSSVPIGLNKSPFHILFSGEANNQIDPAADEADFQQVFRNEFGLLDAGHQPTESTLTNTSNDIESNKADIGKKTEAACIQFTVLDILEETLDTKTFRLKRSDGLRFDYLPGQYITISVEIAGRKYKRSYSLASSPTRPGSVEITVKRDLKGGVVSNWLNESLKVGETLTGKGAFGKFSCATSKPIKPLFLAAGSGIVPILSMLRWLTDTNASVDAVVLLSFKNRYDIIFYDELSLIAARHNNIKLIITLTQEPLGVCQWQGLTGRVDEEMIAGCVPDVVEREVYLCGPDAFMRSGRQFLHQLGLSADKIHCESFAVKSQEFERTVLKDCYPGVNAPANAMPVRAKSGNFEVLFARSGIKIAGDGSLTLLELAEKSGVIMEHECRAGNCGECMIKCLSGEIEMAEEAEIDESDRKRGWIYSCCAYPVSNVVLDA